MSSSRDFTVGLFVIAAFIIMVIVTIFLRHWDFLSNRVIYYGIFKEVSRLDVGAPVLVAGVKVGQVTAMEYIGPPRPVRIAMRIDKNVHLFSNAVVRVTPAQVIGDTTVNIDAGSSDHKELTPGSTLFGQNPPQLEETIARVSDEMVQALEGVSAILNDPKNKESIKQIMANTASITDKVNTEFMPFIGDLKKNSALLHDLLVQLQQQVTKVSGEITKTSSSFRATSGDYSEAAKTLTRNIDASARRLEATIDELQKAVRTNEKPLGETLRQINQAAQQLSDVLGRIKKGQGTLGKLINDPRPFDQLQQVLSGISQTLTGHRESAFPVDKSAGDANPTPEPAHR